MVSVSNLMDALNNMSYESQPLTIERVFVTLIMTFAVAMFVFVVYRFVFKGVLYTRNFNVGLVMTACITALIILPISTNILLSLGMLGALSIVRFRTAIKDPMDIVFTYWAIAVGVACGAGFYMVATLGSAMIGAFVIVLNFTTVGGSEPYLLVLHYGGDAEKSVQGALPKHRVRSRTVTGDDVELMVEVRMKTGETAKVDTFTSIQGVKDAALVSYSGDYVS